MTRQESSVNHPQKQWHRFALACGVIAPLLFTLVYLIEGVTRPGYDAWRQTISALSISDQGWMQIISFLICGLLSLFFAAGVRQTWPSGKSATWGPILLAIFGLGLLIAGVFVTDPSLGYPPGTPDAPSTISTLHGNLHTVGGLTTFSSLPLACFVLARRFAGEVQWKGWAIYSVVSGVLVVACFVAFNVLSLHTGPAGLLERLSIGIGMLWIMLLAIRLLRLTRERVESVSHSLTA